MLEKNIVPGRTRCFYLAVFACALLGPIYILFLTPTVAESSYSGILDRRYSLMGSLELTYDRRWSQGGGGSDEFRQALLLEHRGFVEDPQLLTYEILGRFSHDAGKGTEKSTLMGGDIGINLFRSLPAVLQNNSDYIPHPLYLRYSRETGTSTEYTSYGFSLSHSVAQKKRFLEWGDAPNPGEETPKPGGDAPKPGEGAPKPGENDDLYEDGPSRTATRIVEKDNFPFPRTDFDYDHYDQKSQDSRTVNDILSLRSSLAGKSYDYRFLYENQKQTGSLQFKRSVLQLEPIYRFYDESTQRRFDINNLLRYEDFNQSKSIELGSNFSWSKPMGKDDFSVRGELGYSETSAALQSSAQYTASASGIYKKYLSPSLTNSTSLTASSSKNNTVETLTDLTKSDIVDTRSVRLSDTVSVDISRFYRGMASAFVGENAQGIEYGASAAISTKTRINTSLSYSYSMSSAQATANTNLAQQGSPNPLQQLSSGKTSQHNVALLAAGPLLNNLSFQALANFTLSDVPAIGGTSSQETGTLSGNLLWRLTKSSVALGGNYTQMKKTDAESSASSSASFYTSFTRVLPMKMLFNLYSNWTRSASTGDNNSESKRLEIRPTLRWTKGQTSVDAEYSYTSSTGGGNTSVDQRFYVSLFRKFFALF